MLVRSIWELLAEPFAIALVRVLHSFKKELQ